MDKFYNLFDKFIIIFFLTAAIYFTLVCPCESILYCHRYLFYTSLLIPLLYVFISNQNLKHKMTCRS